MGEEFTIEGDMPESLFEQWNEQHNQELDGEPPANNVDIPDERPLNQNEMDNVVEKVMDGVEGGSLLSDLVKPKEDTNKEEDDHNVKNFANDKIDNKPDGVNSLQDLIFIGRLKKTVDFFGFKMELHTLNSYENIESVNDVSHLDPSTRLAAVRIGILLRSIKSVDGHMFYAKDERQQHLSHYSDRASAKRWLLSLSQIMVDELFGYYKELLKEQKKKIGEVKNLLRPPQAK